MSQALTFPVPAAGSLDQYIQSVNRMPMLSEQLGGGAGDALA